MECYSTETKKEFLPFATAWIEQETIMLSAISQLVKGRYHMSSLIRGYNERNKLMSKKKPEAQNHGIDWQW